MKSFLSKTLFYYSVAASLFIAINIILTSQTITPVVFGVLYLPVVGYFISELFKQLRSLKTPTKTEGSDLNFNPKKGEIAIMFFIFLILFGFSIRNIYSNQPTTTNKIQETSPVTSSSPLVFKTSQTPSPLLKVKVSISDGSTSVNIRQKATIYSDKVSVAKNGDVFEYTQKVDGWYEIKLPEGKTGYLSPIYAKEVGK